MKVEVTNQKLRIPPEIKNRVIEGVVKKLNVKDYYRLKDRLDGEFYLRKQFKRIYSSYYFEKVYNIKLLDESKALFCKTDFVFENKSFSIVGTYNPNKIKIPKKDEVEEFLVVKVVENPPSVEYLGKISNVKCKELIKTKNALKSNNRVVDVLITVKKEDLDD